MEKKKSLRNAMFVMAAIIGLTGTFAGTAHADEWRGDHGGYYHDNDRYDHDRDRRDRDWRWRHEHQAQYKPYYVVQQPQVIVAQAQPQYIQQPADNSSSGFNITIPINFR